MNFMRKLDQSELTDVDKMEILFDALIKLMRLKSREPED